MASETPSNGLPDAELPPVPIEAPTASQDHAQSLEKANAELTSKLAAFERAEALRAVKATFPQLPERVIDELAELVPQDTIEAVIRTVAGGFQESAKDSIGTGGLTPGGSSSPKSFAGLFGRRR